MIPSHWIVRCYRWGESAEQASRRARRRRLLELFLLAVLAGYVAGTVLAEVLS